MFWFLSEPAFCISRMSWLSESLTVHTIRVVNQSLYEVFKVLLWDSALIFSMLTCDTYLALNEMLCIEFSSQMLLWALSIGLFNARLRLFYQPSGYLIFQILWSLVKPVLSQQRFPAGSGWHASCPFYLKSSRLVFFFDSGMPPALPCRPQHSTIGRLRS